MPHAYKQKHRKQTFNAHQEQEQLKADYRDIRRECCTLACELEDQEEANDALKESFAARLAATPRIVESLRAKIHRKLDSFEETCDEMPPGELGSTFKNVHDYIATRCDYLCIALSASRYRGEMPSSDFRL